MEAAMDLLRRMPPSLSQQALDSLLALLPAHSSELLSQSDQPLKVAWDEEHDKHYLLCDYNRDGDSFRSVVSPLFLLFGACGVINLLVVLRLVYKQRLLRFIFVRSPWSSKYKPELEDGVQPSPDLRTLEQEANEVFSIYRDQYYEGGISSVYVWEPEDGKGFAACVLIKKDGSDSGDGRRGLLQEGSWDAIHVIEVKEDQDRQYGHYCLTSTVMLALTTADQTSGPFSLSGSITRQMESNLPSEPGHLCNMGRLIEEMESKLRNGLDQVYFGKTKEVVFTLREPMGVMSSASQSLQRRIASDISRSRS